jgi:hypothetical protein
VLRQNTSDLTAVEKLWNDCKKTRKDKEARQKSLEILAPSLLSYFAIDDALKYAKNYEGEDISEKNEHKTITFYNEREWRYVKEDNLVDRIAKIKTGQRVQKLKLTKEEYENPITKATADAMMENVRLNFEPSDIKYVIVKEENEIREMITALKAIKTKYPPDVVEILTSRIITSEQILHDF